LREFPPVPETLIAHGSPSSVALDLKRVYDFITLRLIKKIDFP
jgi:hypothetical protein